MLCQRCNIEIFHDFSHKHTSDSIIGAIHSLFYSTSDSSNPHLMMLKNLQYSDCEPDPVVDKIFIFLLRVRVKLKKIQKSEKNSDWSDHTHPPHYPNFFFLKQLETRKQQKLKNTEKPNISKKKLKSGLGLNPPTHFRVCLGFFDFF